MNRRAALASIESKAGVPNGIRTRVLALKGPRPGPLDDGDLSEGARSAHVACAQHPIITGDLPISKLGTEPFPKKRPLNETENARRREAGRTLGSPGAMRRPRRTRVLARLLEVMNAGGFAMRKALVGIISNLTSPSMTCPLSAGKSTRVGYFHYADTGRILRRSISR
jgi:hypothetical protein